MKYFKGCKVRLYPTKEQEKHMWNHIHACRYLWNHMIEVQKNRYKNGEKHLSNYQMCHYLTALKKEPDNDWLNTISNRSLQIVCSDLSIAYRDFFNKERNYPCFKSAKKEKPIFPTRAERLSFNNNYVQIEKIGHVRIKYLSKINQLLYSKVYNPRISFVNHKWILSFGIECESQVFKTNDISMGIDLGIKEFAVVSYGNTKLIFHNINNSKRVRTLEHKLKHVQKILSRKNRGNKNYDKTNGVLKYEAIINELYFKLTNIRKNYIWQTINTLIKLKPKRITVEDLHVKDLVKSNKYWRKQILDQGFNQFIRNLEYKCTINGIEFVKAERWFPSSRLCSRCGSVNHALKLSDRVYNCKNCGLEIDRDYNAAINLMRYVPPIERCTA